jgi:hypothetical protein
MAAKPHNRHPLRKARRHDDMKHLKYPILMFMDWAVCLEQDPGVNLQILPPVSCGKPIQYQYIYTAAQDQINYVAITTKFRSTGVNLRGLFTILITI